MHVPYFTRAELKIVYMYLLQLEFFFIHTTGIWSITVWEKGEMMASYSCSTRCCALLYSLWHVNYMCRL